MGGINPHAMRHANGAAQPVTMRNLFILPVHQKQPVGDQRGKPFGKQQHGPFEKRRIVIEQISVHRVHHNRRLLQPASASRAKNAASEVCRLIKSYCPALNQPPQHPRRLKVARGKHAFLKGHGYKAADPIERAWLASRSRVHLTALLCKPLQIGTVEGRQMSEG